eukprot:scaffold27460_cov56-Cyclotella_meneghiniana.AAC.3
MATNASTPTLRRRHNPQPTNTSANGRDEEHDSSNTDRPTLFFSTKQLLAIVLFALFVVTCYRYYTSSLKPAVELSPSIKPSTAAAAAVQSVKAAAVPLTAVTKTQQQQIVQSQSSESENDDQFDCAIFWLRMPKTASTTIAQTFIRPLYREGNFTNVDLGPNSCVTHVGGCAGYWKNQTKMKRRKVPGNRIGGGGSNTPLFGRGTHHQQHHRRLGEVKINSNGDERMYYSPPFGKKISSIPTDYINRLQSSSTSDHRCFPSQENEQMKRQLFCHEYNSVTSTIHYGTRVQPHGKKNSLPTKVTAQFNAGQRITTHVGLDPSLFGWVMPHKPMVFSTFRDPLERIFSSFHYGIQFGGGRPGSVGKCDLPGVGKANIKDRVKAWERMVVKTREVATLQNDTAPYQELLRKYLTTCEVAVDNAYVQFLDPDTKDVTVAIRNLEDYVIVGLQNEMGETLRRWVNITRRSCRGHERFGRMEKVFDDITNGMSADGEVKKWRESKVTLSEVNETQKPRLLSETIIDAENNEEKDGAAEEIDNTKSSDGINLISPDFNTLDDDLKEMITRFTAGDQKVWERVLELFEMQKDWGRK